MSSFNFSGFSSDRSLVSLGSELKSNKKYITGIVWYGKNGLPLAITKFSEPVLKPENHTIVFDTKLDL